MFIDFKKGKRLVKDGALLFGCFGLIAAILLIPFILCKGIAKMVFGILFWLVVIFIFVTFCICFITRGSRREVEAIRAQLNNDAKTFRNIIAENKDFIREFSLWCLLWKEDAQGNYNDAKSLDLAFNLHLTKLPTMSVFEKCLEMYTVGVDLSDSDKERILELAYQMGKRMKDSERNVFKQQIIEIIQLY